MIDTKPNKVLVSEDKNKKRQQISYHLCVCRIFCIIYLNAICHYYVCYKIQCNKNVTIPYNKQNVYMCQKQQYIFDQNSLLSQKQG